MKYLVVMGLLFSGLFAHGGASEHLHVFSTMHIESFILLLAGLIITYFIYEKVSKRDS